MELFSVSIPSPAAGQLIAELERRLGNIDGAASFETADVPWAGESRIVCRIAGSSRKSRAAEAALTEMSEVLSHFLIREKEKAWLERLIRREFDYYADEDIRAILAYCLQLLEESERAIDGEGRWAGRAGKIAREIKSFLAAERSMNLEGFVRFRLRDYLNDLREVVEYAVDEFILDRQYQEFIALLKYFVFVQEAKIPMAHLIHKGNYDFVLLDERLMPIETNRMEGLVLEMVEQDLNFEDMIVSTLITVSPAKIRIHTHESGMQVIRTIGQIFEGRTEVCSHCAVCSPILNAYYPKKPKSSPT
jgi:putative sporulation protein YtxC